MFRANEPRGRVPLLAVALLLPALCWGGVSTTGAAQPPGGKVVATDRAERPAEAGRVDAKARDAGGYQIRCWQQGKLLFEENHVSLPVDGGPYGSVRITGHDRRGRPMLVAETKNATCLIRSIDVEPSWPR